MLAAATRYTTTVAVTFSAATASTIALSVQPSAAPPTGANPHFEFLIDNVVRPLSPSPCTWAGTTAAVCTITGLDGNTVAMQLELQSRGSGLTPLPLDRLTPSLAGWPTTCRWAPRRP